MESNLSFVLLYVVLFGGMAYGLIRFCVKAL
jgi:hypothetical protein